jgi:tRNA A37 threonylcarbamoyladenosine dehydratase
MNVETPSNRIFHEIGLLNELKGDNQCIKVIKFKFKQNLVVTFTLNIHDFNYKFIMTYPTYFPFQPIQIKSLTNFYTTHQYKDGTMCLKWGIDNWSETITGKMLVVNLIELLLTENPLGQEHKPSPSGHQFSTLQLVKRNSVSLFIKSDNQIDIDFPKKTGNTIIPGKITSLGYSTLFTGWFRKSDKNDKNKKDNDELLVFKEYKCFYKRFALTYKDFVLHKKKFKLDTDFDVNLFIFKDEIIGYYITKLTNGQKKQLIKEIRKNPKHTDYKKSTTQIMKKFIHGYSQIYITSSEKEQIARNPIDKNTLSKKIVIFGLGSVGSSVLINLARSGFNNFVIVDGDLFLPNNMSRHVLEASSFGMPKVIALKQKVLYGGINSSANIDAFEFALNGQESSFRTNELLNKIATADIVIDCSADTNLVFSLNELISKHDIPYISGTLVNGGLGHVLLKRNKGNKLSIMDLLETQKKYMKLNNINQNQKNNYETMINDQPFVASMSDVSIISGLIGKHAIDMLLEINQLKDDIYFFSTSNQFLGEPFAVQPITANPIRITEFDLNLVLIEKGKTVWKSSSLKK